MPVRPRQLAAKALTKYPMYRFLPPGALKTYATIKYHAANSTQDSLAQALRSMGGIPTRFHSTAIVAARAAFRNGLDEQTETALQEMGRRFPESAEVLQLRSDLHAHYNRFDDALDAARHALKLHPTSATAAAQNVKYAYHALDHDAANRNAVDMVGRFPVSGPVLWAVAKACITGDQYGRIHRAWRDATAESDERVSLLNSVRQLATAAARGHRVDDGIELFRDAVTFLHEGAKPPAHNAAKLAGRGSWQAIADICDLLDSAGIPFFFAAGTALGFERVGRPLSDDGDIDVGIDDEHFDAERLNGLIAAHPRFVVETHPLSKKVHMRHRGGCPVDFFPYYAEDDHVWHDGVFVRWWNTPFAVERRNFDGLSIPLPENPDRYLTENYADWRTPNADFDSFTSQAPNCVVHWPEYHRLHYMRRAFKALSSGDRRAASKDLHEANQAQLGELVTQQ